MYTTIQIFHISITSYGLFMVLGIACAVILSSLQIKKLGLNLNDFIIIAAFCLTGALIGAKILYILVSFSPTEVMVLIQKKNFSALFEGGLVYYGGLIGGILFSPIGAMFAKTSLKPYVSAVTPSVPFAHAIGRIGCYFAGCCYGFPYNGFLACKYSVDGIHTASAFPIQLVEAVLNVVLGCCLLLSSKKHRISLNAYLFFYAIIRFFLEFFRGDSIRGACIGLSTSQWISLLISVGVIGVSVITHTKFRKKTNPEAEQ